jgi:hypothetical protein
MQHTVFLTKALSPNGTSACFAGESVLGAVGAGFVGLKTVQSSQ